MFHCSKNAKNDLFCGKNCAHNSKFDQIFHFVCKNQIKNFLIDLVIRKKILGKKLLKFISKVAGCISSQNLYSKFQPKQTNFGFLQSNKNYVNIFESIIEKRYQKEPYKKLNNFLK